MTTMISSLPRDLIEEIISRVPLKSMKTVRLTCKSWNSLFKRESFTKMHIGKAATREEKTMMIAIMPHHLYLLSVVVNDDVDPFVKLKGQFRFPYNQISISEIFHYEGLLLCTLKGITRRIVVWNPYLGQIRWIKLRYSHRQRHRFDIFNYALGYEDKESSRSLKLLRFLDYFWKASEMQFFWYEIYDFDSGLWTTLDVTPHWGIYMSTRSVSLKGNSYWPAIERSSKGIINHIICFDFTRERFGPLLPLPFGATDRGYPYVTLSCVKDEKLVALFQHHDSYEYEFEIWITTKIEAEMVSWSKFLRMDMRTMMNARISCFIDEEKKVFMGFNHRDYHKTFINIIGEDIHLRKLDLGVPESRYCWPPLCSYVPSLVQITTRSKMIEQSSLENRRFAQNRSRLAAIEKLIKNHHF